MLGTKQNTTAIVKQRIKLVTVSNMIEALTDACESLLQTKLSSQWRQLRPREIPWQVEPEVLDDLMDELKSHGMTQGRDFIIWLGT